MKLSIIVPSYKEKHLQRTVDELLSNSEIPDAIEEVQGKKVSVPQIEIIVVMDGYWGELRDDKRVKVLHYTDRRGLRNGINMGVSVAKGEYIAKTDAHCSFGKGWDRILLEHIKDNEVHIPLRYFLDTDKWENMPEKAPSSIDKLVYLPEHHKLHGEQWKNREREMRDEMMVETMCFQGSFWIMSRKHWDTVIGELSEEMYGTFALEPLEIALKTWLSGGRVVTNKHTWYAHQHRSFGRTHQVNQEEIDKANNFALDYWLKNKWPERKYDIEWLFERFNAPLPL